MNTICAHDGPVSHGGKCHGFYSRLAWVAAAALCLAAAAPQALRACACGCGVFDVGVGTLLPTKPGGMVWGEYDFMDQKQNWRGGSPAQAADNPDKKIETDFQTAGVQYMFNRKWGFMAEQPYDFRSYTGAAGPAGMGEFNHWALGDTRVMGIYTGMSPTMASGLMFGAKLADGDYTYPGFDRDTELGTGSTDVLAGGYHFGRFSKKSYWSWWANAMADVPVLISDGYRPGSEIDATIAAYYERWGIGKLRLSPFAQALGSYRWRDSGPNADAPDSGYRRVIAAPGLEADAGPLRVYGYVGFPVYQFVNGNQLVAAQYYTFNVMYMF